VFLGIGYAALAVDPLPPGTITVIDDFESYWGTPAVILPTGLWHDVSPAGNSTTLSLGGVPMAGAWLEATWNVAGGWADPGNPTNYDSVAGNAGFGASIAPYNITELTRLHMSLRIPADTEFPTGEYLIEWTGDQWSQTWIPNWMSGAMWFIPPEQIPAILWDGYGWDTGNYDYSMVPRLIKGGDWLEIVVNPNMFVTWGAPLVDFDDLTGINIFAFSDQRDVDSSGASGDFKIGTDGTSEVWPKGPHSGQLLIDNIWFEEIIPEPVTVGLLGLGGLALVRRRR
jgi:hypothetical protein